MLSWVTISNRTDIFTSALQLVNLSKATIKRVFAVLSNRLIDLSSVSLSRFQSLRDMLTAAPVVLRVNFLCLTPPARIHNWIDTR